MKYLESVINSGLFNNLKKSQYIDAFEQLKITSKHFGKGEPVFYEGNIIDRICIVERGSICGEKTSHDGEVHILDVYEENSIFALEIALSKSKKSAIDFISNEDSVVVFVSLNAIIGSPYAEQIQSTLIHQLSDNNIRMAHKIEILAERGLRDRIITYLDVLCRKAGTNAVSIRMNREQLAQYLCVNRSALSNELNKMKREGIIDFQKDKFTIL
ncbi:MAG: Crp/Fnr family transcriptional regulator [Firmicutes bacterium]|nr:Crp/Fnr family transcriptional regulator [Bacillota bacterium]